MNETIHPVILFIGNYGSGKTEVSVNYAVHRVGEGERVSVADLDIVNPYFRSREVREMLEEKGIKVIVPEAALHYADLPVVSPQIKGIIENPDGIAILDVGGDDVGATVLGSLSTALAKTPHDVLQVVNHCRPFTETPEGAVKIGHEIQAAAKQAITGVVGNSHLMDETTPETIYEGYRFAKAVAQTYGVALKFITAEARLLDSLDKEKFDCPILPFQRRLGLPWRRKVKTGASLFQRD